MDALQKRVIATVLIGAVLIFSFFAITEAITKYTGYSVLPDENDFEKCLKEQDVVLYINTNDVSATLNTIQLRDNINDFKIFNCLRDNAPCIEKGITSFPSWGVNNKIVSEDISMDRLFELSGCKLEI
ncbi:MAG: hypothetical protein WC438_04295 [Candidatus Pacearchaeota archaeon]